jgi:hypothetical protein
MHAGEVVCGAVRQDQSRPPRHFDDLLSRLQHQADRARLVANFLQKKHLQFLLNNSQFLSEDLQSAKTDKQMHPPKTRS